MSKQLDHLDAIARDVRTGNTDRVWVLSTGERLYVGLAANRLDVLGDYTVAQALARIGDDWVSALVNRWQYA
ncbi:hypothetical protein [Jeongeupia chitinilytica]|uniref:Uncharacterized protein n=1 Tax=Jeongeupia chitinilytica TaxID=1041641 RepID=A0ABQ3GXB6_9NEIS|nr:hypothetical protein [Jeongeupia chitinilytica]GHD59785.1 hypothetical protein GCM10007350_11530 [Jeongeupia chitinilytica]